MCQYCSKPADSSIYIYATSMSMAPCYQQYNKISRFREFIKPFRTHTHTHIHTLLKSLRVTSYTTSSSGSILYWGFPSLPNAYLQHKRKCTWTKVSASVFFYINRLNLYASRTLVYELPLSCQDWRLEQRPTRKNICLLFIFYMLGSWTWNKWLTEAMENSWIYHCTLITLW